MPKTEAEPKPRIVVTDNRGRELGEDGEPIQEGGSGQPGRRARRAALTREAEFAPRERGGRAVEDDRPTERQTRIDRRLGQLRRVIGDKDTRIAMLENDLRLTTTRLAETGTAAMTHYEAAAKSRLEHWQEKLEAAHEAGDGKAIAEATRQLSSAQFALDNIALAKERTPARQGNGAAAGGQQPQRQQQQPVAQASARTQEWIDDHPWFNSDVAARNIVMTIHNKVVAEGFKPDTDEYFDEIERRAEPVLPDGYVEPFEQGGEEPERDERRPARGGVSREHDDAELDRQLEEVEHEAPRGRVRTSRQSADDFAENGEAEQRRAPVGGVRRAGARGRRDGGEVRLTQSEMNACRDMGIDPAQYARNRARLTEEGKIGPGVR